MAYVATMKFRSMEGIHLPGDVVTEEVAAAPLLISYLRTAMVLSVPDEMVEEVQKDIADGKNMYWIARKLPLQRQPLAAAIRLGLGADKPEKPVVKAEKPKKQELKTEESEAFGALLDEEGNPLAEKLLGEE